MRFKRPAPRGPSQLAAGTARAVTAQAATSPAVSAPGATAPAATAPAATAPAAATPVATALPVSAVVASTSKASPAALNNASAVVPATGARHRYNVRPRRPVCYVDIREPHFDEFIWCRECEDHVYEYCSLHLPLLILPDDEVPEKLDNFKLSRAELSLPTTFFHIAPSTIPGAGLGVFTSLPMPKEVRFGPYCGELQPDTDDSPYSWQVIGTSKKKTHVINAEDPNKSNWMRYVNCSRNWHEQNLLPFQYQGNIYYRTMKNIPCGRELLVFYGSEYATHLGIDLLMYTAPARRPISMGAPKCGPAEKQVKKKDLQASEINIIPMPETAIADTLHMQPQDTLNPDQTNIRAADLKLTKHTNKQTVEKPFQCTMCDKKFRFKCNLTSHKTTHTGLKLYKCSICDKDFFDNSTLTRHKRVHTDQNAYKCSICDKIYSDNSALTKHKRVHTDQNPYKCSICDKNFSDNSNLNRHKLVHTGQKPYECLICDKKFGDNSNLTRHKRVHTDQNAYKCSICDKIYSDNSTLTKHKRVHTDQNPYKCSICDKNFSDNSNLNRHKLVHTGQKPYECLICDKKFGDNSNLTRHKRVHTGQKAYECSTCNKKFNQSSSLTRHKRVHTGQ